MRNAIEIVNLPKITAPEWADFIPGLWPSRNVTSPEERTEWAESNGVTLLRSDDKAAHIDSQTDWRSHYAPGHVFVRTDSRYRSA